MIIYLHGFCSAPASPKVRALREHLAARGLAAEFWCEQLPWSPRAALELVNGKIEEQLARCRLDRHAPAPLLVGSSLGGFYASCLAERHGVRAVLINPAVIGRLDLDAWLGTHHNLYTGERFELERAYIDELRTFDFPAITHPERYWLLVEEGDERLDYRHALARYAGARQSVEAGGNHSFSKWQDYLDGITDFAGLGARTSA
ncbi:MAG: alpha/beta fold hydrolase [Azoarcus sp.]|jgi:predicted esterase YcpF (UPF0227 family)|nr:alpha/beta fold hydrolase [Azoarcus sp.]